MQCLRVSWAGRAAPGSDGEEGETRAPLRRLPGASPRKKALLLVYMPPGGHGVVVRVEVLKSTSKSDSGSILSVVLSLLLCARARTPARSTSRRRRRGRWRSCWSPCCGPRPRTCCSCSSMACSARSAPATRLPLLAIIGVVANSS